MKKLLIGLSTAAVCGALGYMNYHRLVPQPESQGTESFSVETIPLIIQAADHTLSAEILTPQGKQGKLPTVICSHGFGSSGKLCKDMVGMSLTMSGYQVVVFDFYGGSTHSKSGGAMTEMSVFTEKDDLNAVIDYVKSLNNVDPEHLFLLGESQGGFVTAITAAERPQDFKGIILYYPAFVIPDDARKRFQSADEIPDTYTQMGRKLGRIYAEKLLDYDVYSVIPAYAGPVLILHGDQDPVVNISYSTCAKETYKNAELITLYGQKHGFMAEGRKAAAKFTYEFLQRQTISNWRQEILTIHADLEKPTITHEGPYNITTIPFSGSAKSSWFSGKILPGAADVQRRKLWSPVRFCADYTLEGTDYTGEKCQIHIVNVDEGNGWNPTVTTDSKALDFLNGADCTALLQGWKSQLTVRIYAAIH